MKELVEIKDNTILVAETAIEKLKDFQKMKLQMDLYEKELKEKLKEAMKQCGIKQLAIKGLYADITQVKGKETIDSARLKKELPEVAKEYTKVGKPSERFTLRLDD